jgi:16S rRNA (adenine1518-N6/adenine1519-N6)-dimethyltransferase
MSSLFSLLHALMVEYGFKPNRVMSQNFVVDDALVEKIVEFAGLEKSDVVLEVGCGTGFLTEKIMEHCKVIGVEKDPVLAEVLRKRFDSKNFVLVEGDFLKEKIPAFSKVVCFPPYSISSDFVLRLTESKFSSGVIVFQKDFAQKLMSFPGLKEYNATAVLTQYFFELEILIEAVSPKSFFPSPSVFSSVVKISSKKRFGKAKNDAQFKKFVKELFRFKNKNLSNALMKCFPFIEEELKLSEKKFKKTAKTYSLAEEKVVLLEVDELVDLFNEIVQK